MSLTSPIETCSLMPTSGRSCASESGSGVDARRRAHSARVNSTYRESSVCSPGGTGTTALYAQRASRRLGQSAALAVANELRPQYSGDQHQPAAHLQRVAETLG